MKSRRWPDHHPYFSEIVAVIQKYFANTYESMPDPDNWHFVTLGDSGPEGRTDPLAAGLYSAINDKSTVHSIASSALACRRSGISTPAWVNALPAVGICLGWVITCRP